MNAHLAFRHIFVALIESLILLLSDYTGFWGFGVLGFWGEEGGWIGKWDRQVGMLE